MLSFVLPLLSLGAVSVDARTPGVDVAVQQLFNSSGTDYPTSFTRDIVPVFNFSCHLLILLENDTLT